MNVCVVIPAAGQSRRFGSTDKLMQDMGGRPLLVRTVEIFSKRDEVGSIVVAGPADSFDEFKERIGGTLAFHGVKLVAGGREHRWESVRNAMAAVPDDATHVAVHDAARPGLHNKLLDRLFEAAESVPAVVPAVEITATVRRVADEEVDVSGDEDAIADAILGDSTRVQIMARKSGGTIDRARLMEVQTPQVFEKALIQRAYAQDDCSGATDDAELVERLGEEVFVVAGDACNLKVTTQADLRLMRAVLGVKPPAERPVHKRF